MKEIWKPFPDERLLGAYEVSSLGRVRSLDRTIVNSNGASRLYNGVTLKQVIDKHGYYRVTPKLRDPRRSLNFLVSRVVAEVFCKKPDGCDVVNHMDGNKLNNQADNLEWTTVKGNTQHSFDNGLQVGRKGINHHSCLLSESNVIDIILRLSNNQTQQSIADIYGVTKASIAKINKGITWRHIHVDGLSPPYSSGTKSKYHRNRG
ncbi:HNH endonuclease [Enterobacter sp. RHBSTW-00901]|uniref:NUMOD4 domain-containing protein n=1 Tax=Enterobacter sp. RHBSTW-00901 TaxID=2742669 RepID=UPI0015F52CF9|nr:NUMOD4 domain-containing protein [Enterobacter sp. RHBSTW-00901]MBA7854118.1 HNH endonuclease [Enterobacter sp. RHBSTW-00901]